MEILQGQELFLENLMTTRVTTKLQEVPEVLNKFKAYIESMGAKVIGNPISTTFSENQNTGEVDIQFYTRIDKRIEGNNEYIYKEKLLLKNCIKVTHKGNPNLLVDTYNKLNNYIIKNGITPISTGFNITTSNVKSEDNSDNYEVDIYISISPNFI